MPDTTSTLAICGPTASGKSAVALAIAEQLAGEVVSCDSVQVYRGFVIGCAKPSAEEQARVPHHLIDVVDWDEPFDAQRYRTLASAALCDIRARGRTPIVCGGTGLYLRALRWGLIEAPAADAALRRTLYEAEAKAPGTLYARLRQVDPDSARRIEPNNIVYIVRALEIHATSGQPASRLRREHGFAEEVQPMCVAALDWPRAELRRRIEERTAKMLAAGLVQEVEQLLAAGVSPQSRPMRSVGYKEVCAVVLGHAPVAGLEGRIVKSTVAYARRQRTWLRRERGVVWVHVQSLEEAIDAILPLARRTQQAGSGARRAVREEGR